MSNLDPELLRALRATRAPAPEPAQLERLAARIDASAAALFATRGRRQAEWYELAAGWSSTLIPAGLAVALASLLVLWRVRPALPTDAMEVTVLRAATAPAPRDLVEQALNELVAPSARTLNPPRR
jgi:hypothetical protein